jgi:hypothetical protein
MNGNTDKFPPAYFAMSRIVMRHFSTALTRHTNQHNTDSSSHTAAWYNCQLQNSTPIILDNPHNQHEHEFWEDYSLWTLFSAAYNSRPNYGNITGIIPVLFNFC